MIVLSDGPRDETDRDVDLLGVSQHGDEFVPVADDVIMDLDIRLGSGLQLFYDGTLLADDSTRAILAHPEQA